jgi:DNA-binding transcriptional ArsR family regulator
MEARAVRARRGAVGASMTTTRRRTTMAVGGRGRKKGSGARAGSGAPWGFRVIQALADPSRWRLVELLAVEERTVGELAGALGRSLPCTSHHVSILKEVGVLVVRREGHTTCCRLAESDTAVGKFVRGARTLSIEVSYQLNHPIEPAPKPPSRNESDAVPEFETTALQRAARTASGSIPMEDFLL